MSQDVDRTLVVLNRIADELKRGNDIRRDAALLKHRDDGSRHWEFARNRLLDDYDKHPLTP